MPMLKKYKEVRIICKECGIEKKEFDYYLSRIEGQVRMDICKDCFHKEFQNSTGIFNFLKKYNLPLLMNLWETCGRDLRLYIQRISSLPQYRNLQWEDSSLEDCNHRVEEINFYDSIIKNLKTEANKLNEKLTKIRENNSDMNMYISTLKSLRETLELIARYDWKLNYSEYKTEKIDSITNQPITIRQVSVWESNHENTIRNHKIWQTLDFQDMDGNSLFLNDKSNVNWDYSKYNITTNGLEIK